MMRRLTLLCGILLFAWFAAVYAEAALIRANAPSIPGATDDGSNLTYDTDTGLWWLDLTITQNLSYNSVLSELAAGGMYESFRFAIRDDIQTLFAHAGVTDGVHDPPSPGVLNLISYIGATGYDDVDEVTWASGFYDDQDSSNPAVGNAYLSHYPHGNAHHDSYTAADSDNPNSYFDPDAPHPNVGSWLVTQAPPTAVPEPTTFTMYPTLFTLGIAIGWIRRRRKAGAMIG